MASSATFEFTDDNFQAEAMESDLPVLVDFWAEWCTPCRALGPVIDELATEYAGKAKVGKLDVDSNRQTALQFNVNSIPMIIVIKGGEVVNNFVGIQQKSDLAAALDGALAGG